MEQIHKRLKQNALIFSAICAVWSSSVFAQDAIVTANKTSTYFAFGEDLKKFAAPALDVLPSNGSADNIKALSKSSGVTLAIAQSDVYQAYVNLAQNDPDPAIRQWAADLLSSLRVVMPLYHEEIYFIVRQDSPLKSVQDIEGKRLAIGPVGSGTNLTAKNIYKKMFGKAPTVVEPFIEQGVTGEDDGTKIRRSALWRLVHPELGPDNRKVDVFVLVDGQPVELLSKLGKGFRLLSVDPENAKVKSLMDEYQIGTVYKKHYGFVENDQPIITVPSYLITAHFRSQHRNDFIKKLATNLCANYDKLYAQGHDKWKTLAWSPANPKLPTLATGWTYSDVTSPILENCHNANFQPISTQSSSAPSVPLTCSMEDRAIGLCE